MGPWDNLQETSEENPVDASEEVGYQVEQIQECLDDTREVVTLEGRRKRAKENPNSRQVKLKILKRPKSYKPKIALKEGVNIKVNLEGEEVAARVTGRSKVSGSFYNYFNIRDQRGLDWNVNLETAVWSRTEEDVMMVLMMVIQTAKQPSKWS